jgi:hypothetical protein
MYACPWVQTQLLVHTLTAHTHTLARAQSHALAQSDANTFTVVEDTRPDEQLGRGTRVSLYLKEEAQDFLETKTIKNLITKYSEFINFDIYLYVTPSLTHHHVNTPACQSSSCHVDAMRFRMAVATRAMRNFLSVLRQTRQHAALALACRPTLTAPSLVSLSQVHEQGD